MATRDYAKRGRKPRSRGRKAAPKASFPWVRLLVVLALIAGFGYFLWSIQGASDEAPEPQPATEVVKPKPQPKAEPALPEKPKETWEYIETLPEKQVEVEVPKKPDSKVQLYLRCASFRTKSRAEEMKARIAFMGLESEIRRTNGSSGVWYQVSLGPFDGKRATQSIEHVLERGKIEGCYRVQAN